ncbi:uncharacterized protein A4U43_C07F17300 [Asparagus officinalis]|uniref:Uncharacterized protein n=1 Tax=Asparagus officinalis TaxID=4686 RepID=A0A5P1ECU6_ASPOF|nr:uncharacterized protein A4U43_C07F17300 [Asparagus officinalis]
MESKNGGGKKKAKRGGFKTMPFILGNDICDKFATAGFNANMVSYLTSQLHLPLVTASNTLSNLSGTSSLTTIIGALIADSFAGRFWTITVGSLIYQLFPAAAVAVNVVACSCTSSYENFKIFFLNSIRV